jgi:hypothetical protein
MKQYFKNLFSVGALLCPTSFIFSDTPNPQKSLSGEELAAIRDMSSRIDTAIQPISEKAGNELIGANVRADSKDPTKFETSATIELVRIKFDTNRFFVSRKKWSPTEIIIKAHNRNKKENWTENCKITLHIGFDNPGEKKLLFKASCLCLTLPNEAKQSIFFFLPNDIQKKYDLIGRVPDYCAVKFSVGGIHQEIIIVNREGKNAYQADPKNFHKKIEENSNIQNGVMRNVDQLPFYADVAVGDHPSLRLEIDT